MTKSPDSIDGEKSAALSALSSIIHEETTPEGIKKKTAEQETYFTHNTPHSAYLILSYHIILTNSCLYYYSFLSLHRENGVLQRTRKCSF